MKQRSRPVRSCRNDANVLRLAAVDRLHVEDVAENEGDLLASTEVRECSQ